MPLPGGGGGRLPSSEDNRLMRICIMPGCVRATPWLWNGMRRRESAFQVARASSLFMTPLSSSYFSIYCSNSTARTPPPPAASPPPRRAAAEAAGTAGTAAATARNLGTTRTRRRPTRPPSRSRCSSSSSSRCSRRPTSRCSSRLQVREIMKKSGWRREGKEGEPMGIFQGIFQPRPVPYFIPLKSSSETDQPALSPLSALFWRR